MYHSQHTTMVVKSVLMHMHLASHLISLTDLSSGTACGKRNPHQISHLKQGFKIIISMKTTSILTHQNLQPTQPTSVSKGLFCLIVCVPKLCTVDNGTSIKTLVDKQSLSTAFLKTRVYQLIKPGYHNKHSLS